MENSLVWKTVYEEWYERCVLPLNRNKPHSKAHKKYGNGYGYSAPFVTAVPPRDLRDGRKTLLVFGQEAHGGHRLEDGIPLEQLQRDAEGYFEDVMTGKETNASPFWRMMRMLNEDYRVCWGNLDKLHRVYGAGDGRLSQQLEYFREEEMCLLAPLSDGKNILQWELELIRPDAVLFVTGPRYRRATRYALGLDPEDTEGLPSYRGDWIVPLPSYRLSDGEIPILWTYHPNSWNFTGFWRRADRVAAALSDCLAHA